MSESVFQCFMFTIPLSFNSQPQMSKKKIMMYFHFYILNRTELVCGFLNKVKAFSSMPLLEWKSNEVFWHPASKLKYEGKSMRNK